MLALLFNTELWTMMLVMMLTYLFLYMNILHIYVWYGFLRKPIPDELVFISRHFWSFVESLAGRLCECGLQRSLQFAIHEISRQRRHEFFILSGPFDYLGHFTSNRVVPSVFSRLSDLRINFPTTFASDCRFSSFLRPRLKFYRVLRLCISLDFFSARLFSRKMTLLIIKWLHSAVIWVTALMRCFSPHLTFYL